MGIPLVVHDFAQLWCHAQHTFQSLHHHWLLIYPFEFSPFLKKPIPGLNYVSIMGNPYVVERTSTQAHKNHITSVCDLHSSFISLMASTFVGEGFNPCDPPNAPPPESLLKTLDLHLPILNCKTLLNSQYDQPQSVYIHLHPMSSRKGMVE